ncbi:biotin--[bacterium]|nr:biotin--[acetyl-CoA-carboxylase] ligase [bacterium]
MYNNVKPHFHTVAETDSTNSYLKRLAAAGSVSPGYSLMAEVQTAGRGRGSRSWHSCRGGLTASYWIDLKAGLLRPEQLSVLPLTAGLAVIRAMDRLYRLRGGTENVSPLSLKWPNDIWAEDGKVGGILCELATEGGRPSGVIVGVGLNLRRIEADDNLRLLASSFAEAAGLLLEPEEVFTAVGESLYGICSELSSRGFVALASEWYGRCLHRDKFIKINIRPEAAESDGEAGRMEFRSEELAEIMALWESGKKFCFNDQNTVYGFTKGIAENGALQLQVPEWREDGSHAFSERIITMGDVSVNL